MLNLLLCDDEKQWCEIIKEFIHIFCENSKIAYHLECFEQNNLEQVKRYIRDNHFIDIAFIDIDLHGEDRGDGIELAKKLKEYRKDCVIIFITSHPQYALKSYGVDGFGYLLKPTSPSIFYDKFRDSLIYVNGLSVSKSKVIHLGKTEIVEKAIVSIEVNNHTMKVYTITGAIEVPYATLKSLLSELSNSFIMVNRSVIINLKYVTWYDTKVVCLCKERFYEIPARKVRTVHQQIEAFFRGVSLE